MAMTQKEKEDSAAICWLSYVTVAADWAFIARTYPSQREYALRRIADAEKSWKEVCDAYGQEHHTLLRADADLGQAE